MKQALSKTLGLTICAALISCITSEVDRDSLRDPFTKRIESHQSAMALLRKGRTQLKSGNSAEAIFSFARARKLNPWHDDIKDMYIVAVKIYAQITSKMVERNMDCQVVSERLNFISNIASDRLVDFKDAIDSCGFEKTQQALISFSDVVLPNPQNKISEEVYKDLGSQLNAVIERNRNIPVQELLISGIKYLQAFKFQVQKVTIDPNTTELRDVSLLIEVKTKFSGFDKYEYCDHLRNLLEVEGTSSVLRCNGLSVNKKSILVPPSWYDSLSKFFPVPKKIVIKTVIETKNGTKSDYRNKIILSRIDQKNIPDYSRRCDSWAYRLSRSVGDLSFQSYGPISSSCVYSYLLKTNFSQVSDIKSISIFIDADETYRENLN